MSYCTYVNALQEGEAILHKTYHDQHYGYPIEDDHELFGRLLLEINQAGLSWSLILQKEAGFRKAYDNFNIRQIAAYGEQDSLRLLNDAGIVRNRLKIAAAIYNANAVLQLQELHGSFKNWLDLHHPLPLQEWMKLFKRTFKFTGGEIVNEFLMSTGYLPGAHDSDCPIYRQVLQRGVKWQQLPE